MDPIISSAIQQQQQQIAMQTQMSVLKKSMDVEKEVGSMLIGLIENAASAGQELGMGAKFDAYA